jgi:hypothetical protein
VGIMQGQDVLTCPTIANNHKKTSICGVFLLAMMRDRTTIKLVISDINSGYTVRDYWLLSVEGGVEKLNG